MIREIKRYHLYSTKEFRLLSKKTLSFVGGLGVLMLSLVLLNEFLPTFITMLKDYTDRLILGISTYFGNYTGGIDQAAIYRNVVFQTVPQEFLQSDIRTMIFGNGNGYQQLAVPYLQAFTDLGLIGDTFYLLIQLVYPIKILSVKSTDAAVLFAKYIGITTIAYNLYTGIPYNHYKFVGLVVLVFEVAEEYRGEVLLCCLSESICVRKYKAAIREKAFECGGFCI